MLIPLHFIRASQAELYEHKNHIKSHINILINSLPRRILKI